jgi:hypothetical protein
MAPSGDVIYRIFKQFEETESLCVKETLEASTAWKK